MGKGKEVINEPFWMHPDGGKEITMAEKEYIEREAAIAKIREEGVYGSGYSNQEREDNVVDMIESIPTANVRPVVRGKWIGQRADSEMCSACGVRFYISALFAVGINDEPNYCPNCGADMRERKENKIYDKS